MQVPNEDEAPVESEVETPHIEASEEAIQFITSIGKLQKSSLIGLASATTSQCP